MKNKRYIGSTYEKLAVNYLIEQGLEIILCNFRCPRGEIDIIARENEKIIFVEVKYRANLDYGEPEAAVNFKKQQRMRYAARVYLSKNGFCDDIACRFDVISVLGNRLKWIKDVF